MALEQPRLQRDDAFGLGDFLRIQSRAAATESRPRDCQILIVDDDVDVVRALTRLLLRAGYVNVQSTNDPTEARGLCHQLDPDLVVLDLNMPELDGIAVLEQLRVDAPRHLYLPVLMLTADTTERSRHRALAAGASDFVTKPFGVQEILLRIRNLLQTRFLQRQIALQNQLLEQRVSERTRELEDSHLDTLERLALAAEYRDDETGRHTERVGEITALLGSELGIPEDDVFFMRRAAPLHDVGKIAIPDVVLRKPGPLTPDEWSVMKRHTVLGAGILSGGRSHVIRLAEQIARFHHEHWDGNGYPEGRRGNAIPLAARLVTVADVFDALTSERAYRAAWPVAEGLRYIQTYSGQRFDPAIAALCERTAVREALISIRSRVDKAASPPLAS
jgi:putative two-component system response regulator